MFVSISDAHSTFGEAPVAVHASLTREFGPAASAAPGALTLWVNCCIIC